MLDEARLIVVDGTEALAYVIVRPDATRENGIKTEAASLGLSKTDMAHVLRALADKFDSQKIKCSCQWDH